MTGRDLVAEVTAFARTVREAGIPADTARVVGATRALAELDARRTEEIYWATRLSLCAEAAHVPMFDAVFRTWFGVASPVASTVRAEPVTVVGAGPMMDDPAGSPMTDGPDLVGMALAGSAELLAERDMATLSAAERAQVHALIALLARACDSRRSLRLVAGGRTRVDLEGTVRQMLHNGGEPSRLHFRHPSRKPRGLLLLVDVSQSMEDYRDAFLRFSHAAVRARSATTEVFTLGTRLTRVTAALRERDPDLAMAAVARLAPGQGGGTRLGATLRELLRRWSGHRAVRSATVVLASDGWESGDPQLLAQQVSRLKQLSHQLVWVNPQAGAPNFTAYARGLRASQRLVDAHVAGHSYAALRSLAERVSRA